ncbi:MAG: hypothetical protein K5928_09085 [Prevotella sp.]|nr:hypothetical protein [Prevotella sp.]
MNSTLDFVPAGGLGNRMKAMAAAWRLAHDIGATLHVVWFQDWGLGCRFDQLFCLSEPWNGCLREATFVDKLLRDRPRRHNLFVPQLYQRLHYDRCIGEEEATQMMYSGQDFAAVCRDKRVWLSSHVYFLGQDIPDDSFDLFLPIPKLQAEIERRWQHISCGPSDAPDRASAARSSSSPNVVGVHIRRTDNQRSISDSPTALFVERMRQEPDDTVFYIATDSEEEKRELRQLFGSRLHCAERQAERGTLQGMEDALVEMYLLSRTRRILGSAASTYSMTAAAIGRTPLEIIKL